MASIEKRTTQSTGQTTYRVKVRLKGYPAQTATFQRLTDAKKWAQHTETAIREGRHFKTAESKKHTLAELVERYIADVFPTNPKMKAKRTAHLEWWREQIGDRLLADVTPALIVECRDKLANGITRRGKQRAPATVVRYMAGLSHAFTVAVNEWGWLEDSPMRKVKKPTEPRGRVRFLDDDERARLLEASKDSESTYLYPIVVLALSTGMRRGEILGLKWQDVDTQAGFLILHDTKNGERRRVPVAGHALAVIRNHAKVRRIDSDYLFPGRIAGKPIDIRKPWEKALKRAEIDDFHFHDLRHSAASYLAMNGASLAEIAEVLGHKTLQMVKRYAHLSEAHTTRVVASMNEKIFGDA
jgi:integrase